MKPGLATLPSTDRQGRFGTQVRIGIETEAEAAGGDARGDFGDARMVDAEDCCSPEGHAIREVDEGIE